MIALLYPQPQNHLYQKDSQTMFPIVIMAVNSIRRIAEQPPCSLSQFPTRESLILYATTSMSMPQMNKNKNETYLEKLRQPIKKEFGIQILATKKINTQRNLIPQHPSWKIAATVPLPQAIKKIKRCIDARTKLILIITEGPMQLVPPPELSGHQRAEGSQPTKS